jgi:glycine betaine/proline transport system substrate-binding protein
MVERLRGAWRSILGAGCAGVLVVSGIASATGSGGGGSGVMIRAAEFNWTAAAVTNAILEQIVKDHPDLGVSQIVSTQLDPAAAWAGAARGNVDLITEVALPNQQALADKAKAKARLVSQTYGNAAQGWFVPTYAVQPGGAAAGLKSITQLNDFKSAFGGKLIDADPGWVTTEQNTKRLKAYGIDYQHVTAGAAAELGQLERSYRRKQPLVIYLYRPHWVFAKYKLTQLQEPEPYKPGCFTGATNRCAIPTLSAWIAAASKVQHEAPRFYALLRRVRISLPDMERMLEQVDVEKKLAPKVAERWLSDHKAQVDAWVKG